MCNNSNTTSTSTSTSTNTVHYTADTYCSCDCNYNKTVITVSDNDATGILPLVLVQTACPAFNVTLLHPSVHLPHILDADSRCANTVQCLLSLQHLAHSLDLNSTQSVGPNFSCTPPALCSGNNNTGTNTTQPSPIIFNTDHVLNANVASANCTSSGNMPYTTDTLLDSICVDTVHHPLPL